MRMTLLTRIFAPKRAAPVEPARLDQVTAPAEAKPRPARAMVYREASVVFESGYSRKGIVLDYSDRGVRLRFQTNEGLPKFVTLNARAVGLEGVAEVIWQKGSEAGLKLLG